MLGLQSCPRIAYCGQWRSTQSAVARKEQHKPLSGIHILRTQLRHSAMTTHALCCLRRANHRHAEASNARQYALEGMVALCSCLWLPATFGRWHTQADLHYHNPPTSRDSGWRLHLAPRYLTKASEDMHGWHLLSLGRQRSRGSQRPPSAFLHSMWL